MAEKRYPEGTDEGLLRIEQEKIIGEWEARRKFAADHGTRLHNELQQYFVTGEISEKLEPAAKKIANFYRHHYKHYDELVLYSEKHLAAGTTDKAVARSKKINVIDFMDYKTNIDNGITYDSCKEKENKFTFENKYFLEPFIHVEESNYFTYSMQLSKYAYFAETTYHIKIGKLNIAFVNEAKGTCDIIPVPYMRNEVEYFFAWREMMMKKQNTGREVMIDEKKIVKTINDEIW
jgi:hypothetical protein